MRSRLVNGPAWGKTCLSLCAALVIAFTGAVLPGGARASAATPDPSLALVVATDGHFGALVGALAEAGISPEQSFPPTGVIAAVPQALADRLAADGLLLRTYRSPIGDAEVSGMSPALSFVAAAWNALLAGPSVDEAILAAGGMAGDALAAVDADGLTGFALDPALYQQSEYMIGKIAVNIVLVESTGAVDPSTEDWTLAERQLVFQQVVAGLAWWQSMRPEAHIQFVYDDHYSSPLPVSYEPVNRPQSDERLWIAEAMGQLGYSQPSYITSVRHYNRATRARLGADWAFTVFVVNSANDADNHFADGYFAYAYVHGPFLVMTSENNGYGAENMAAVMAHETGHIFGALDEYASAGVPPTAIGGYLGVPNGNSAYGGNPSVDSIMKGGTTAYTNRLISVYAAAMVGWRDSDSDGILDPADTTVAATASASRTEAGISLTGTALEVPWPSPRRNPLSMNVIVAARYRINGGPWRSMSADDGAFDSGMEAFSAALPPAPDGDWTIEVAGFNSVGNAGSQVITLTAADGVAQVTTSVTAVAATSSDDGLAVIAGAASTGDGESALTAIEYRVDSGAWQSVAALDGGYDSSCESFSVAVSDLATGTHTFQVRAWTASPWTQAQVWQQDLAVQNLQIPSYDSQVYVPLVTDL